MADVDLLQQQCCKCRGLPRFDNRVTARLDFITALFNNNYSQMARLSSPFVHRTEVAAHLAEVSHENLVNIVQHNTENAIRCYNFNDRCTALTFGTERYILII